jgi:hypothetical protein
MNNTYSDETNKTLYINKKTKSIPIINNKRNDTQYSINKTLFDPFQHSPPNDYLIKLNKRISLFTNK